MDRSQNVEAMTLDAAKRRLTELGEAGWAPLVEPAGAVVGSMAVLLGLRALLARALSNRTRERSKSTLSERFSRVGAVAAPIVLERLVRRFVDTAAARSDQCNSSRSE